MCIIEHEGAITNLLLPGENILGDAKIRETPLLKTAGEQVRNYFAGRQMTFSLPLAPEGSEFTQRIFHHLIRIPSGETRSYSDIAECMGNIQARRAVGRACHNNPIPIIIPCHRVVGSDGTLHGYRGGLPLKALLLKYERDLSANTPL